MQTRFRVYDRLGAERGQLPNPLEAVWVPPLNTVPTLTIHYSLIDVKSELLEDNPEVAFEYWDPAQDKWVEPFNARLKFFEEDFDHLEDTPTKKYTFIGVGEVLLGQLVYGRYGRDINEEGRVVFQETNAGEIISFIWDNAESRGWTGFDYSFSATADSNGQPWEQVFNISYETTNNLASILDGLMRQGAVDYVWEGRTLHLYNAHTYLAREKSTGDTPVLFNLSGGPASVDGAPELTNTENLATHVVVEGENNLRWEFETGAILPEGRREVVLQYAGVDDVGTARVLADPVILKSVAPLMNTTRQFHLTDATKIKPLIHYRIGDWCLVEREGQYQRLRIISMSLWVNQNGVHGYVTLGDNIDDALNKMYQKIQRLSGGKANEGVGAPPMPKNRTPSLPTNLLLSAEAYPGPGGQPTGLVAISLSHNFLDTQGDPINLDHFEIQMKEVVTLPETRTWQVAARIYEPATSGTISGVDIYDIDGDIKQYDFRAYAISDESKRSGASATTRLTMVEDSVPPPVLSTPTARASGTTFTIEHDGLGSVGEEMPRDYIVSHVEMGTSETGPWTSVGRIVRRGSLTIAVDGYYTRWFRMIAEDSTGNLSDAYSGVVSATTTQLVPQATFDQAVDDLNSDIGANTQATIDAQTQADKGVADALAAKNAADAAAATASQALIDAEAADALAEAAGDAASLAQADADAAQLEADRLWDSVSKSYVNPSTDASRWYWVANPGTVVDSPNAMSGKALQKDPVGGHGWWEDHSGKQPFDPAMLYRITAKYRVVDDATTYDYQWTGTPHASPSTYKVDGVETRRNRLSNPSFETNLTGWTNSRVTTTLSTAWAASGANSARLESTDSANLDTFLETSMATLGLVAGKTYTFSATIHLPAPLTGSFDSRTRKMVAYWGVNAFTASVQSSQAPNAAGTYRLSLTATLPADTNAFILRLYHGGAVGSGAVHWDAVMVEEGATVGAYFDGSFIDNMTKGMYLGLTGFLADGVTRCSIYGDNATGNAHYVVSNRTSKAEDGWVTVQGYLRGHSAQGTAGTYPDPNAPGKVHNNVRFICPMVILDYNGGDGTWELSHVTLDALSPEAVDNAKVAQAAADQAKLDAVAKADAAEAAAIASQAYSKNPSFEAWTGTIPDLFGSFSDAPTKDTATKLRGKHAARFTCTATSVSGLSFNSTILGHAPNLEYFTVELEFQVVSGASLSGAAVLIDWVGMSNNRAQINLKDEIPAPVLGKWYRLTKVLRRPTNAAGTFSYMGGFLLANWAGNAGAQTAKTLVVDWLNIRPSSAEEITSYGTPAAIAIVQGAADAAQGDASQALTDAQNAKNAADAAQADATQALTDAETAADAAEAARLLAVAAQSTADGKTTVSPLAPTEADLANKPANALWTRVVDGKAVGAWYKATANATVWTAMPFDPVMIPQINIGTGTFGELDGVRLKAKSIGVRELIVADYENYAPGGNFDYTDDLNGWNLNAEALTKVSVVGSAITAPKTGAGCLQILPSASTRQLSRPVAIPVAAGERWKITFDVKMSSDWVEGATPSGVAFGGPVTPVGPLSTTWVERSAEIAVTSTAMSAYSTYLVFYHTAGTVWVDNLKIRRMDSGVLTIDGAMKARHVDTNSLTADTGFIANLKANSMVADIFQGKAFVGGTFTGTTFQSHAEALTGIKLTSAGLTAYDTTGAESFKVSSATGTGRFAGRISTTMGGAGSTLLPAAESTDGKSSGLFISKDGTLTGGITAGAWVGEVLSSNPEMLYLRGLNNGHVEVVSGTLYVRGSGQRVGNFANWAIGDASNGSNYLPNLWVNPAAGNTGYFRLTNAPTTSAGANALIAITPEGVLYRSTSSIRYKADVQDYPVDHRILSLQPRTWVDREPMDKADPFHRYLGYIAEEVVQVMPEFVTYNDFGEPESVTYDRMPSPAVIGLLKEFDSRLSALEGV